MFRHVDGCEAARDCPPPPASIKHREKGIRIFMWPKVIYIFPSAIVALICSIGMWRIADKSYDPSKPVRLSRLQLRTALQHRPPFLQGCPSAIG